MQHVEDLGDLLATIDPFIDGVMIIADEDGAVQYQTGDIDKLTGWPAPKRLEGLHAFGAVDLLQRIRGAQTETGVAQTHEMLSLTLDAEETGAARDLQIHAKFLKCGDQDDAICLVVVQRARAPKVAVAMQGPTGKNELVSSDPRMLEIMSRVGQVAPSSAFVLLQGESGTGKTHIARMIHLNSPRRDQPLIEVNCAAIPEQLIESELFGHVKGAFTGATSDRAGRFQAADGGTLLLDEVGEIPLHLQAKLLKAVQEQKFEMVGSDRSVSVDVRVISATNRDLKEMVEAGEFRADLFYRLAVIPMIIPPLRERPEDIPLMLKHLCTNLVERGYPDNIDCSPEAMNLMMDYFWPGNVREMENAVEHAVVCAVENTVRPESLPQTIREYSLSPDAQARRRNGGAAANDALDDDIVRALESAGGNKTRAAALLGIDRTTLWRRMQRQGLVRA